LTEV